MIHLLESDRASAKDVTEYGADLASVAVRNKTRLHTIYNDVIGQVITQGDSVDEDICPDSNGTSITMYPPWSSQTTTRIFKHGRARDTVDLWSQDIYGRNCLNSAAARGNLDILAYLLEQTSPVELEARDKYGCTAVHYAVRTPTERWRYLTCSWLRERTCTLKISIIRMCYIIAAKRSKLEVVQKLVALDRKQSLLSLDREGTNASPRLPRST